MSTPAGVIPMFFSNCRNLHDFFKMSTVRWVGSSVLLKGSKNTYNSQSYPNKEGAPMRSPAYCLHNAQRLSPTPHLRRDEGGE